MPDPPTDLASAERRIAAVRAVENVMTAVWALARAQLPQVEEAAAEAFAYVGALERIVDRVAGPPLPVGAAETLWVALGPERPFCGALARHMCAQLPRVGAMGLVGARLGEAAQREPELCAQVMFEVPGAVTPEDVGARAQAVAARVLAASTGRDVVLLHMKPGSDALARVPLLTRRASPLHRSVETLSPSEKVLEAVVQAWVGGVLAMGLSEALRAEVRARLAASEGARRACERELEALGHHWRALRQSAITEELVELTAGARSATPFGA